MWFEEDLDKQIEKQQKLYTTIEQQESKLKTAKKRRKRVVEIKHVKLGRKFFKKIKKARNVKKQRNRKVIRSYVSYMKSKVWERRRNTYWKNHERRCVACKSTNRIELHHGLYGTYDGSEADKQLFPLCQPCHREFHQLYGSQRDMLWETFFFIEEKRY